MLQAPHLHFLFMALWFSGKERQIFFWVWPVFQFRLTVLYQQLGNLCHRESKLGHVSAPSGTGLQRIRLVPSMSHAQSLARQTEREKFSWELWQTAFWIIRVGKNKVQFSHSVVSDSLRPHESQHIRPPCPSPTPRVYSNSCPSNRRCHPAISSSVVPFSSCPQSLPASGSFPMSQLFT